jgi:transcriptional regulator with XRE-family HTH domain
MTKPDSESEENRKPVPEIEDKTIAIQLVTARKALGWSQNELHLRSGISRESIKQYETGRNKPGAREIQNLCRALRISPNRLLFGRDNFEEAVSPLKDIFNDYNEDDARQRFQLTVLFNQLTADERNAVLTLIEPILISRKGEKELREMFKGLDQDSFAVVSPGIDMERTVAAEDKIKKQLAEAKKKPG